MDASALESRILSLEGSSRSLDSWLTFWIVLIVIGVAVEILAVVLEYRSELKEYRRGTIHTPEKPSLGMLVFNLLGASLVAIGVAGEFAVHIEAGSIETNLRNANMELSVLFQTQAANANLKTEQLRARILRVFGPRDLTQGQLGRITARLKALNGVRVDVYGFGVGNPYNKSESDESIRIAKQLVGALTEARVDAAGWILLACSQTGSSNVIVGVMDGPRDTRVATTILKALEPEIDTYPEVTTEPSPLDGCVQSFSAQPNRPKPDAALSIVVGRKIPSLLTPTLLGLEDTPK